MVPFWWGAHLLKLRSLHFYICCCGLFQLDITKYNDTSSSSLKMKNNWCQVDLCLTFWSWIGGGIELGATLYDGFRTRTTSSVLPAAKANQTIIYAFKDLAYWPWCSRRPSCLQLARNEPHPVNNCSHASKWHFNLKIAILTTTIYYWTVLTALKWKFTALVILWQSYHCVLVPHLVAAAPQSSLCTTNPTTQTLMINAIMLKIANPNDVLSLACITSFFPSNSADRA